MLGALVTVPGVLDRKRVQANCCWPTYPTTGERQGEPNWVADIVESEVVI